MTSGERAYVALDLETTGLDPARDRITEVGALRFDAEGRELAAWERLVDPGVPIPPEIQRITGIANADVRGQPAFAEVADELAAFVGDAPIVGQNVSFDLNFLKAAGVEPRGPALDTLRFSRLLLPTIRQRNLTALAEELGLTASTAHRALPDARTTAAVFTALRRRAAELPDAARAQLARLVALDQPDLAHEIAGDEIGAAAMAETTWRLPAPWRAPKPLEPAAQPRPVTAEEALGVLAGATGVIERFEQRPQQSDMAKTVADALAEGGQWLIEAGTGVGKSLAYLVPAALHAIRNGKRVVVSTNTIALQEQLIGKDVPALRDILLRAGVIDEPDDLRVALLKGRPNYLCLQRWIENHRARLAEPEVARLAASLSLWLPETQTGDYSELTLDRGERRAWAQFSSAGSTCAPRRHRFVRERRCFLRRARDTARAAHLVVVNHALLLTDVAKETGAVPDADVLIVDEAHNLEDEATKQFGREVRASSIMEVLNLIHRPRTRESAEGGIAATVGFREDVGAEQADALIASVAAVRKRVTRPFKALGALIGDSREDRVSITPAMRSSSTWEKFEDRWRPLNLALAQADETGNRMLRPRDDETLSGNAAEMKEALRRLKEQRDYLEGMVAGNETNTIVWASAEDDGMAALNSAPIEAGPLLAERLFRDRATVIATSATLQTADGSMGFSAKRMGLPEAATLALGSPFDYERSTLLATPTGLPEPNARGYDEAVADAIARLARASDGRALALFTSHAALQRTANLARPALEADDIEVLVQGERRSPRQLIERLREHPRSIVFGTASLREGVDVRGDALSLVIVARFPFPVPTDPVHRARAALYDNGFDEYSLPMAILDFRQAFGRLIRDRTDRGVVAVLDSRVRTKPYGQRFIGALPRCTRLTTDVDATADRTREWLAR